jgi:hypothetical protein
MGRAKGRTPGFPAPRVRCAYPGYPGYADRGSAIGRFHGARGIHPRTLVIFPPIHLTRLSCKALLRLSTSLSGSHPHPLWID